MQLLCVSFSIFLFHARKGDSSAPAAMGLYSASCSTGCSDSENEAALAEDKGEDGVRNKKKIKSVKEKRGAAPRRRNPVCVTAPLVYPLRWTNTSSSRSPSCRSRCRCLSLRLSRSSSAGPRLLFRRHKWSNCDEVSFLYWRHICGKWVHMALNDSYSLVLTCKVENATS